MMNLYGDGLVFLGNRPCNTHSSRKKHFALHREGIRKKAESALNLNSHKGDDMIARGHSVNICNNR